MQQRDVDVCTYRRSCELCSRTEYSAAQSNKRKIVSFLPGKNIKRIKPLYVFWTRKPGGRVRFLVIIEESK